MTVTTEHELGRDRRRKEDAHLITGRTTWTDNMTRAGTLHLAVLRSPVAHARLTKVDVSPALERNGVVAAFTGADLADDAGGLPTAWVVTEDMVAPEHKAVAVDEVRHVGEIIAVVAATDRYTAADAIEAIDVEFEQLPAVLDMEEALKDGAPLVHSDKGTNKTYTWTFDSAGAGTGGDANAAVEQADVVVARRFRQQRLIPSFMEPRSVYVAREGNQWTMWSATQVPHILRLMLSLVTNTPEHEVRVVAPDVGGGFGGKLQITPEEIMAFVIAKRLNKPVKYTESRSESMTSAHHGRDQIQDITIAADRDGTVRGLKVELLADMGAYIGTVTAGTPLLGAFMYNAIYKIPAYRFDCTGVFTTKPWTDAYRGAGRPEATFAIERIMDELAVELDMDPMELRRKNWITHEEFPFTTVAGLEYDSGNYEAATDKAVELFGYDALREEQAARRRSGDAVQLGIGISTYTEACGIAPSRILGALNFGAGGWEHASVRMLPTGKVEVVTGSSAHGQGHETAWSQIVAERLGVPFEDVLVVHGDTLSSPKGLDTYGSRSLAVGGMAVVGACDKVIEKAKVVAAHMLEASPEDIEFSGGSFSVRGTPDVSKTIQEVAFAVTLAHDLPDGFEPSLDSDATFDPANFSFPHGTHLCAAEVDTETGAVRIRSYVCVDDVGKVVNPLIVEGQVHGGIAQGIAQALFEEAVFDADGNLVTGTFVDYLVPSANDLPAVVSDRTETPATTNALGVKGVGEAGTIASTPAVINAVVDALRPLGVNDVTMPASPQSVWTAIQQAAATKEAAA